MTSLFTQFVARGIEVPVIDPRLIAHVDVLLDVTQEEQPAAPLSSSDASTAPVDQQTSPAKQTT